MRHTSGARSLMRDVRRRSERSSGDSGMKRSTLLLAAAMFPLAALTAESVLFRTTITTVAGRPLVPVSISVEEVDRTATYSVVEMSSSSDAADALPSSTLAGLCALARHRGERYIQAKQILRFPLTLEVTFPKVGSDSANPPMSALAPNVFPVANCPSSR